MLQALSTASTGMQARETQIQVIANNLANASTPGFKVSRARFQDLLYVTQRQAGTQSSQVSFVPTGATIGLGTKTAAVDQIFTEGELDNTGNPTDVAIQGDGFSRSLCLMDQLHTLVTAVSEPTRTAGW